MYQRAPQPARRIMEEERLSQIRPPSKVRDDRTRSEKLRQWLLGQPAPANPLPRRPLTDPKPGRVGIACSGGGIRSAAYNLGALQVLRDKGVFGLDAGRPQGGEVFVSAVSGGSYIAASFATVASTSDDRHLAPRGGEDGESDDGRFSRRVYAPSSPEEVHLRNHSSYMAPGLGGKLRLALRLVLGMLANFAVIGVAMGIIGAGLGALYGERLRQLASATATGTLHAPTAAWLAPLALLSLGALLSLPDLFKRLNHDSVRRFCEAWATRLIVAGLLLGVVLVAVPQLILWIRGFSVSSALDAASTASPAGAETTSAGRATDLLQALNLTALLTAAAGALRAFVARKRSLFAFAAGAVAGPLAVAAPILWVANTTAVGGFGADDLRVLGVLLAAAMIFWLVVDLNQWSLHPYYRRRLSSAFFVRRDGPDKVEEWPYDESLRISQVDGQGRFPELIVCAAANVSDHGATPPGRSATPFTFCREDIGGPLVSACPTVFYEQNAARASRDVTLPAAVAMSGAAFSPVMGKKSIRALTFLLALTNLRLGVWLPNPQHVEALGKPRFGGAPPWARSVEATVGRAGRSMLEHVLPEQRRADVLDERCRTAWASVKSWALGRRPRPHYLFKEMLGRTTLNDRFLYITDGGHFDNLGVVELLRRGCTTIYCLDAGGDPAGTYAALGEAIALARSDLQVDVDIDPSPIDPPEKDAPPAADHVVGRIRYRATPTGIGEVTCDADDSSPFVGRIVYCRAAVTSDAPYDVRAFQERDARFPNHSTLDQLFDDEKFESYRALGAHTADRALETLRRHELRDAIRQVLVTRARRRATICHRELIAAVQSQLGRMQVLDGRLGVADRRLFRSLLDDIAAEETGARRPSLGLLVRERTPRERELRAQLAQVWDYWAPEVAAVDAGDASLRALVVTARAMFRSM
jgi:hypothetical protein